MQSITFVFNISTNMSNQKQLGMHRYLPMYFYLFSVNTMYDITNEKYDIEHSLITLVLYIWEDNLKIFHNQIYICMQVVDKIMLLFGGNLV